MSERLEDYEQHASLMEAIIATPDDDLPRLIYADWLEEIGRHEHAKWLREQLDSKAMWRYPSGMSVTVQVNKDPLTKDSDWSDWAREPETISFEVAPAIEGLSWTVSRGLPCKVSFYSLPFTVNIQELKRKYPIVNVEVDTHNHWPNSIPSISHPLVLSDELIKQIEDYWRSSLEIPSHWLGYGNSNIGSRRKSNTEWQALDEQVARMARVNRRMFDPSPTEGKDDQR